MNIDHKSPNAPMPFDVDNFPLGYAYVPMQKLNKVYSEAEALSKGTLFPELYKPLGVYGNEFSGKIPTDVCPPKDNKPFDNMPYDNMPYDNKPYDNKPYENKPYENKPYENKPYENKPYENMPYGDKFHDYKWF